MPKAVKRTQNDGIIIETLVKNELNNKEILCVKFRKNYLDITDMYSGTTVISREFLPEFLAALQTTYPDAFALIDKHQKPPK